MEQPVYNKKEKAKLEFKEEPKEIAEEIVEKKEESSKSCEQMLSEQVNHELVNFLKYQYIQNWCDNNGFFKAASFFEKQSLDERNHSLLVLHFMQDRGYKFSGYRLEEVCFEINSLPDVINIALETEVGTTKKLAAIRKHAIEEGEMLVETLMFDMLKEQIEEEALYLDLQSVAKGLNPEDKLDMLHLEESFK
jgi:ferritin